MEGCNLAGTCPSSCIFLFLCFLAIFHYRDVTFKPNPLYPKKWALNLEIVVESFTNNLTIVTNHALLTLVLLSFSTFLLVVFFDGVNVCSTRLWSLLLSFFYFLLNDFISNFFLQCFLSQHYQVLVWCDHMSTRIVH
jgi:hypothetical protein